MYIEQLDLENLRAFAGVAGKPLVFVHPECDFRPLKTPPSPEDERLPRPRLPNVTLLLGDNGSGKTTILRAIAASAFGPAAKDLLRDSSLVRHGENTARIFAKLVLHQQDQAQGERIDSDIELNRRGERLDVQLGSTLFEQFWGPVYESENDAFFVVGYGATRRVERLDNYDSGARSRSRAARDLRVQSLFEEAFSLIPLGSWLPGLASRDPWHYKQVEHLLNALLAPGHYRFSGEQAKNGDYVSYWGDMPVPFQSLSDGYRAFVGWVADLLYHVCFGCPPGRKLIDSQGIVLVDEIDLHLHPKWQMQVIKTVAKALPKMQFVFTSHSPLVAGSLEWMNIITLKVGTRANRTVAKRLKQSIHGLDADQILLTDFFGLKTTIAPAKRRQLDEITDRIRSGDRNAPLQLIREMSSGTEEEE
jgi:AAA domain, putative AbiEii toxin, Type IV TA system